MFLLAKVNMRMALAVRGYRIAWWSCLVVLGVAASPEERSAVQAAAGAFINQPVPATPCRCRR